MTAHSLRDHLQSIYEREGVLTPPLVVEEARPDDSPLHSRFEWDDSVAGEEYRRAQASSLIRSVKITYGKTRAGEDKSIRGFFSIDRGEGKSYVPAEEVIQDEFSRTLILNECKREIEALKKKYGHLREFYELLARTSREGAA